LVKYSPGFLNDTSIKFRDSVSRDETEEPEVTLPEGYSSLALTRHLDPDLVAAKKYLERRGLSRLDVARWRVLAVTTGQYRRRVIIPSFDDAGRLNYFVARSIDADAYLKYKNPKVPKDDVIFNEIDIDWSMPITLVEGVFDAMKCPPNTIPILGSSISMRSKLYKKLIKHQPKCTVALDPDLKAKAFKLAKMLKGTGCDVEVAFAPDGLDFGDMKKQHVVEALNAAERYTDIMRISHKISEMRSGSII
jgi:DNA primase